MNGGRKIGVVGSRAVDMRELPGVRIRISTTVVDPLRSTATGVIEEYSSYAINRPK